MQQAAPDEAAALTYDNATTNESNNNEHIIIFSLSLSIYIYTHTHTHTHAWAMQQQAAQDEAASPVAMFPEA